MSERSFQAAVFDVDGTLFDTERLNLEVWQSVARELGLPPLEERYLELIGQNRAGICAAVRGFWGEDFPVEPFLQACSRRSQAHVEQEGVPLKPGAREILDFLRDRGVPLALATSTGSERTLRRLEMTGLAPYFSSVVTGDQVDRGKPDPEIYLTACRRLGVDPVRALAVEDSANGIRSARAAGMAVAMVPDLIPPAPELERLLWGRFDSLLALRDHLALLP